MLYIILFLGRIIIVLFSYCLTPIVVILYIIVMFKFPPKDWFESTWPGENGLFSLKEIYYKNDLRYILNRKSCKTRIPTSYYPQGTTSTRAEYGAVIHIHYNHYVKDEEIPYY